jgi:hypothetical protein
MKSFSHILVTVMILGPVSVLVAQPEESPALLSQSGTRSTQVNAAGCQTMTGEFPEFPRTECIEKGTRFQRIVLNPKTVLRKFDAEWYDFRHPDALDPENLKNLDTLLTPAWSSNESTVLRVDFSQLDKFDWDKHDDVLRAAVFWQALAAHYASLPDKERSARLVSFEIFQPADLTDAYRWAGIRATLAASINQVAPNHTIWAINPGGRVTINSSPPNSDVNLARLQHGVNLGRYTGQNDGADLEWPKNPVNNPDSPANQAALADLCSKFDHVRIVITPSVFISETTHFFDFEGRASNLAKLRNVLTSLWKGGCATIVTIDGTQGVALNDTNFLKSLEGFWQKLSQDCAALYDSLGLAAGSSQVLFFEVLNEPQETDPYRWEGIQEEIVNEGIRKGAKDNVIIAVGIGGALEGLLSLVPLREKNIIYSFHFYDPPLFTQQGADWNQEYMRRITGLKYPPDAENANKATADLPVFEATERLEYLRYGWSRWGANYVAGEIDYAQKWARQLHVTLICDEFGVKRAYDSKVPNDQDKEHQKNGADRASRVSWIKDVRSSLHRNGIPWTFWDYNSDTFGATLSKEGNDLDNDLMQALFSALP